MLANNYEDDKTKILISGVLGKEKKLAGLSLLSHGRQMASFKAHFWSFVILPTVLH